MVKLVLEITLVTLAFYLLGAFCAATFNIALWDLAGRFFVAGLTLAASIALIFLEGLK
jgi:hypothetical protein